MKRLVCLLALCLLLLAVFIGPAAAQDPPPDGRISMAALRESGANLDVSWGERLQSLLGMVAILGLCYGLSKHRAWPG